MRKFQVFLNHLLRVDKAHEKMRPTREIVEARDKVHWQFLEAERRERKEDRSKYVAQLEVLKWVLQED